MHSLQQDVKGPGLNPLRPRFPLPAAEVPWSTPGSSCGCRMNDGECVLLPLQRVSLGGDWCLPSGKCMSLKRALVSHQHSLHRDPQCLPTPSLLQDSHHYCCAPSTLPSAKNRIRGQSLPCLDVSGIGRPRLGTPVGMRCPAKGGGPLHEGTSANPHLVYWRA